MKRYLNIVLIFISYISIVYSQPQFEWVNPNPQGDHLKDVFFYNRDTGYAVGINSVIRTTDSGKTWDLLLSFTGDIYRSVHFFSSEEGFVVGDGGVILKTINSGDTWEEINTGINVDFNHVVFTCKDTGFIAGDTVTLLMTTDGGIHWDYANINFDSSLDVRGPISDIQFFNKDTGYALWESISYGHILITTNGGNSWTLNRLPGFSNCFYFINTQFGYVTHDNYWTDDGGETWNSTGGSNNFTDVYIYYNDIYEEYWGVGLRGYRCYLSYNRFGSWYTSNLKGKYLHFFNSSDTGFTVGDRGRIYYTTDAGEDVCEIYWPGPYWELFTINFINKDTGFIGSILYNYITTDGGRTWSIADDSLFSGYRGICFSSNDDIFICSEIGRFLKSTDYGSSWTVTKVLSNFIDFFSITITEDNSIYMVGDSGSIVKSNDEGENWSLLNSNTEALLKSVYFINNDTGFVAGVKGIILRTIDSGNTWSKINTGVIEDINKVYFSDHGTGYCVGEEGLLLETNDKGNNWTQIYLPTTDVLCDIKFKNNYGIIVGGNGTIFESDDYGNTWKQFKNNYNRQLNCSYFVNDSNILIVGKWGVIIKYTPDYLITSDDRDVDIIDYDSLSLSLYPNPAREFCQIELNNYTGQLEIEIFTASGVLLSTYQTKGPLYTINLKGYKQGVYVIKINIPEKTYIEKLVVK